MFTRKSIVLWPANIHQGNTLKVPRKNFLNTIILIFAFALILLFFGLFVSRLILIAYPLYRLKGMEVRNMEKLKERTIDRINRVITLKIQSN